jgi:hypothetical protein
MQSDFMSTVTLVSPHKNDPRTFELRILSINRDSREITFADPLPDVDLVGWFVALPPENEMQKGCQYL